MVNFILNFQLFLIARLEKLQVIENRIDLGSNVIWLVNVVGEEVFKEVLHFYLQFGQILNTLVVEVSKFVVLGNRLN